MPDGEEKPMGNAAKLKNLTCRDMLTKPESKVNEI